MNRAMKTVGLLCIVTMVTAVGFSDSKAWLSTRYQPDPWSSGSWYRAPVTDGYMDVMLLVEEASFNEMDFSIAYDSTLVQSIGSGSFQYLREGLSLTGVSHENLDGNWIKTTFAFSGAINIGTIQYESDCLFRIRLVPLAEGTVPIGLWTQSSPRFPDSYKTCSLSLRNAGVGVPYDCKEWNDSVQLITFTDKTSASVFYQYDLNLGTPISNGFFRVTYADSHVEEFHQSDAARGITIDTTYGGYWMAPQPDAIIHSLIFPEYQDIVELNMSGGWSLSHQQPDGFLMIPEAMEGFHGVRAGSDDLTLTASSMGIGEDFDNSEFKAAIIGSENGVLNKTVDFEAIDNDTVRMIIRGGIPADYYNLYVYKDSLILGRAWFGASVFYPVTFIIRDSQDHPLPGAVVGIPQCGMFGCTNLEAVADENGCAVHELPGNSEWGQMFNYIVTVDDKEDMFGTIQVFGEPLDVPIVMGPIQGVDMDDLAILAENWSMQYCQWSNYCNGADRDRNGTVDIQDLVEFAERWLLDK